LASIANGESLAGLSLDALDALLAEAEVENKMISAAKRAIVGHLDERYSATIEKIYAAQGKDFGTVRISDSGYDIVVDTPKKVEWSQDELRAAHKAIEAAGDDPAEYLKVTFAVEERHYTAWPQHIQRVFEPARTVRPGSRTIKLARKEAA
jgi:hypothetical protein